MHQYKRILSVGLALGLALPLASCEQTRTPVDELPRAEKAPNNSFVVLSGTVASTTPDSFVLDYGSGQISVEMDGWSWYPERHALFVNDDVTVYGYVDADFYERRTIEASSVYVSNLGTQFFANGADEEDFPVAMSSTPRPSIELQGKVRSVGVGEFQLDTGTKLIDVHTQSMPYNPLDTEGFQQVREGDRVRVSGRLGYDLFEDHHLKARTITSLQSKSTDETTG